MHRSNISVKKITSISILGIFSILLTSCGTHNQNSYADSDGIYSSQAPTETEPVSEANTPSDSYYKQYFNSKTQAYEELEDGTIFTDIDAYSTSESLDDDGYIVEERTQEEDYGAWGENSEQVTVNVYNNGGWGYWNRPYWWYGAGWGFYNNWCSPFWGVGYGWGYPFYGYYGWGYPYYYGGYYNNFYNPYYGNAYNGYTYNRGRRNSDYYNGRTAIRGDRYSMRDARRGQSIARTSNSRRATNNFASSNATRNGRAISRPTTRRNYARNNTTRTRPSTFTRRSNTQRPSTTRSNRNVRPTTRTNVQPSTRSTNRRSSTRTSTPRRSSGVRRSSGASRSRGTSRSGGGRRGRG